MRYIVDIPPEVIEQVNKLLQARSDKYRSPQDFIVAAVQNQLYLESQESGGSTLEKLDVRDALPERARLFVPAIPFAEPARYSARLLELYPQLAEVETAPLSDMPRQSCLWGQYNRLFPVKIVTRVAANLARINGSGRLSLITLQEAAADEARGLGTQIEKADRSMGRKRGTIIAAALPIGRGKDKAKLRFKNQFVGYLASNKNGEEKHQFKVEGAAPTLKFLDIRKEEDMIVAGITDFGLKFACFPNPVIDSKDFSTPFSPEEVTFLLDHVASQLPQEAKLIQLILSSVKEGVASPEELNEKVRSTHAEWKKSQPITMRAGVVSRISELGLLGREKDGVKVTYKLTELGEKYLARLEG